jgi:hypothetical protein
VVPDLRERLDTALPRRAHPRGSLPPNYVPSVILLGAFLTAVVLLHALWDTFASVKSATFFGFLSVELLSLLVALVSLVLLIRRVRKARRAEGGSGRVA